ncbi:MAG: hypothetical protein Q4D13_08720 [Erysipelotrichaceae bacterium]|nr:hypothetical protein [Erysipelotrichaceae bacterium]
MDDKVKNSYGGYIPHCFVDAYFALKVNYDLLLYKGSWNPSTLESGPLRLADNRASLSALPGQGSVNFTPLDLSVTEENMSVVSLTDSSDGLGSLSTYNLNDPQVNDSMIFDSHTYSDNQIQMLTTKNKVALFRLVSYGNKTMLVYQFQNNDGSFDSTMYKVSMPNNLSVADFMVVQDKTGTNPDYVYIGASLVNESVSDINERAKTSRIAALTIDLSDNTQKQCLDMTTEADYGKYYFTGVKPAGRGDTCNIIYTKTKILDSFLSNYGQGNLEIAIVGRPSKIDAGSGYYFTTGCGDGKGPAFWVVDKNASTDSTLKINGYSITGYYNEYDTRCNVSFDISNLDLINKDSAISDWQYMNGFNFFIAGGNAYWMEAVSDTGTDYPYHWQINEVYGGTGLSNSNGSYQMILNNGCSEIYLVGIVSDYGFDSNGNYGRLGNRVVLRTITCEYDQYREGYLCRMHGQIDTDLDQNIPVKSFTAVYNPDSCSAKGLSLVYAYDGDSYTDLYHWLQNADRGMVVTNVYMVDTVVFQNEPHINCWVTYKNLGYYKEGPVRFRITDSTGTVLQELVTYDNYRPMTDGEGHWNADLYTGDTDNIQLAFAPNPAWDKNSEQEIFIEVEYPAYSGNSTRASFNYSMNEPNLLLKGHQSVVNGVHYADLEIINDSLIAAKRPDIMIEPVYYNSAQNGASSVFNFVPEADYVYFFDAEDAIPVQQVYNASINIDNIWKQGVNNGLRGINVYMLDENGNPMDNSYIYLENPYMQITPAPVPPAPVTPDESPKTIVDVPSVPTYTYNGNPQTALYDNDYYTVSGATATDAGTYTITLSLKDKNNFVWSDGSTDDKTVTFTINKADYDMSGISFDGAVITYDGKSHELKISGTLPNGVSVTYQNNGQTKAGEYEIIAIFSVADPRNYNVPASMKAYLVITEGETSGINIKLSGDEFVYTGEEIRPDVIITDGNKILVEGVDYVLTYSHNIETGIGVITITGIGEYEGLINETIEFTITDGNSPLTGKDGNCIIHIIGAILGALSLIYLAVKYLTKSDSAVADSIVGLLTVVIGIMTQVLGSCHYDLYVMIALIIIGIFEFAQIFFKKDEEDTEE